MSQIQITIAGGNLSAEQIAQALASVLQQSTSTPAPVRGPLSVNDLTSFLSDTPRELDAEEVARQLAGNTEMHADDLAAFVSGVDNRLVFESLEKFQEYVRANVIDGDSLIFSDVDGQVIATYRR